MADLRQALARILGLTRDRGVVIVGAGKLGTALADYAGFNREGLSIVALVDDNARKIGRASRRGVPILAMEELPRLVRGRGVRVAILAVPAEVAQQALDRVVRAGVRAVLNFAPARLKAPERVTLKEVDLRIQLENLAFHLARAEMT